MNVRTIILLLGADSGPSTSVSSIDTSARIALYLT